jgi:hypothetical protein
VTPDTPTAGGDRGGLSVLETDWDGGLGGGVGSQWHRLTRLGFSFGGLSMDVDATAQGAGIPYTADIQLKFQQFDNVIWPCHGDTFDSIHVAAQS